MPRHERRLIEPPRRNGIAMLMLKPHQRVHNYRVMRGWTQEIAAEHHGVSLRTWQRWESPSTFVPRWLLQDIIKWARRACPTFVDYVS